MIFIDFTHDPYYGEITEENQDYIIRNCLKKSTTEFYSYITLYVITRDRQLNLAVLPVRQGLSKVHYLAHCFDLKSELGLHIEVFCLVRAFCAKGSDLVSSRCPCSVHHASETSQSSHEISLGGSKIEIRNHHHEEQTARSCIEHCHRGAVFQRKMRIIWIERLWTSLSWTHLEPWQNKSNVSIQVLH